MKITTNNTLHMDPNYTAPFCDSLRSFYRKMAPFRLGQ
jgi:hypothetical protein